MVVAAALLMLSCDLHGTESSPAGVLHTAYKMRYRFDEAHHQIDFSNNGGAWRSFINDQWKVASWTSTRVVARADKGTQTFDLNALTLDNHVVEHRGGMTIDQVGHATCRRI
jgi:hypothetical protein